MSTQEYSVDMSKPDTCPKCGTVDSFEWGDREAIDNYMVQDFRCEACGATGREYNKLTFDGYEVDVEG